jgi:hypothetical protein
VLRFGFLTPSPPCLHSVFRPRAMNKRK